MGYDHCRSEWALCYDADGNRKLEGDLKVLVGPIGGRVKLKTRLNRWDRWRDRRWERSHNDQRQTASTHESSTAGGNAWWGTCPSCGFHIDNPAHVLGCAHSDAPSGTENRAPIDREAGQ